MRTRTVIFLAACSGCLGELPEGSGPYAETETDTDPTSSSTTQLPTGPTTLSPSSTTTSSSSSSSTDDEEMGSSEEDSSSTSDAESTSSGAESTSSGAPLEPQLWLTFDGNFTDSISGDEALPVGNMQLVNDVAVFDGESYVDLSYFVDAYREAIELTVSMEVRADDLVGSRALLSMGDAGEEPEVNSFHIVAVDAELQVITETGNGTDHVTKLADFPNDGRWHDVQLQLADDRVSLWIDGTMVAEEDYTPAQTEVDRLLLGSSWNGWTWAGALDDVQIWTSAVD